jgi:hypothetical protein
MSKRTATIALAAAALVMIGTAAPASAREVVRYNAEVQTESGGEKIPHRSGRLR